MKKTKSKLSLNREALRYLSGAETRQVVGGEKQQIEICSASCNCFSCQDACTMTQLASGCTVGSYGGC